jgi:hypothetical protein
MLTPVQSRRSGVVCDDTDSDATSSPQPPVAIGTWTSMYGEGHVVNYRADDHIYEIQLPFGRLYGPETTILNPTVVHRDLGNRLVDDSTRSAASCSSSHWDDHEKQSAMELNVAYEALESMRKLNLEMTCQEKNIPYTTIDLQSTCTLCLLARPSHDKKAAPSTFASRRLVANAFTMRPKISPPCLVCGTPICRAHSSTSFRKESIIMCLSCEALFGISYVTQILTCTDPQQRRIYVDKMIELYDRTVLLLRYSTIHTDDVCVALQLSAARKNKVGIGSSSAGIVSGVLGIVSAATIFTPVGPPLLIASLLFGGSATAAQTGSELRNSSFCSEPHRLTDRIIALHGICWNILRVTGTLRDALLLDHLRTDLYTEDEHGNGIQKIMLTGSHSTSPISEYYRTHQAEVLARATNLGSIGTVGAVSLVATMEVGQAVTAVESGVVAARGAQFFSRSTTAALNTLRFARFAGGTLAAATLVFEAHSLKNTIRAIQAGNPCEKVDALLRIRDQIRDIPSTQAVDAECERYLEALTRRQRVLTELEVASLLMENTEILQQAQELALQESTAENGNTTSVSHNSDALESSERSTASLRERIMLFKRDGKSSQAHHGVSDAEQSGPDDGTRPPLSLRERIELYKVKERSNSPPLIRQSDNVHGDSEHAANLIC